MRRSSWLVLALALFGCSEDRQWGAGVPPGNGGHHGGPTGGNPDAGTSPIGDAGSNDVVAGKVCKVADVRFPGNCAAVARAGIRVDLETPQFQLVDSAETDAQGHFSMPRPTSGDTFWLTVSDPMHVYHFGAQVVPLVAGMGSPNLQVAVITEDYYGSILAASLAAVNTGNALVFLHLVHGETPVEGAVIGPLRGAPANYDQAGDERTFTPVTPTTGNGFAVWFDVPPALSANYQVTAGGVMTQHVGSAYPDAVTFLSDVI